MVLESESYKKVALIKCSSALIYVAVVVILLVSLIFSGKLMDSAIESAGETCGSIG